MQAIPIDGLAVKKSKEDFRLIIDYKTMKMKTTFASHRIAFIM